MIRHHIAKEAKENHPLRHDASPCDRDCEQTKQQNHAKRDFPEDPKKMHGSWRFNQPCWVLRHQKHRGRRDTLSNKHHMPHWLWLWLLTCFTLHIKYYKIVEPYNIQFWLAAVYPKSPNICKLQPRPQIKMESFKASQGRTVRANGGGR